MKFFYANKNRTIHMQHIFHLIIVTSIIPAIILILILFIYTIQQNVENTNQGIENAEHIISLSVTEQMQAAKEVSDTMTHKMDYLLFSNSSDSKRLYRYGLDISQELSDNLSQNEIVSAFYLYNTKMDYLYTTPVRATNDTYIDQQFVRSIPSGVSETKGVWSYHVFNSRLFLFYQIGSSHGIYTLIFEPALNTEYRSVCASAEGHGGEWSFMTKGLDNPYEAKNLEHQIRTQIVDFPLEVVYEYPKAALFEFIDQFQIVMLILIVVLLFLAIIPWFFVHKAILIPMKHMEELSKQIQSGDSSTQEFKLDTNIWELQQFSLILNNLLDNVQELHQKVYEQKLDVSRARLQFLQLQIRPHFYLNCLKNMHALLTLHKYDKIDETIMALSDYFAHCFRDIKNFVSLQDELTACQSYITLQNIMSRDISLDFDLDSQCLDAQVLPMTILTFVENCVKHSDNQIPITIHISVELTSEPMNYPMVRIQLSNTGSFSKESLAILNHAEPSEMLYKHEHIGISNVRYRLWLIYQDHANVVFSNQDDQAVVTINMPYEGMNYKY